ncbi:MAG: tryptophan--tRNA ligase [Patescibacteria group bacterium]|jgi:tryptophanyl-tRNA synthetase
MEQKKVILTGDRPTGKLHLGHFVGSLQNRVKLQHEYEQFILIADLQALTDNSENPEKIRSNVLEVALDYLAVGIDPEISTICIQSELPALSDLTMYYLNLVSLARLQRNPTVKDEMNQKGFGAEVPAGFLTYPISQAADISAFKATLVPVGADQLPMIEQTNEIVRKFNRVYNSNALVECEALVSETGRLPGIDGSNKMSKSLGNCIYLSDSAEEIKQKVMNMYTDPDHIHVEDPGKVEGNTVFAYLDIFDENKDEIAKLKEEYKKGGLGDVTLKNRLNDILQELLNPIRAKREELAKDPDAIMKILEKGSEKARAITGKTLEEIKSAMKLDYFA